MSNKKDKNPNRRSLIAGAAAAGVALPMITIAANAQGRGTRVVVDLGGVELPAEVADKLGDEIRRAVLVALAHGAPKLKFKAGPLGPGIRGYVLIPAALQGGGMMHE